MTSTGRFTLPSEENFAEKTKELAELWGADAIRNSDGTHLDEAVLALGKKIYSAYFPTRAHNEWITLHMDETPQVYLLTDRILAESDTVDIPLMESFFAEQLKPNRDADPHKYWEVVDRTTGEVVDSANWTLDADEDTVHVSGVAAWHEYTVSFLAYIIWDPVEMYNHLTNDWGDKEHEIPFDIYHPATRKFVFDTFEQWLKDSPQTDVVRFTTFFYQFTLLFDEKRREKVVDWFGCACTVSPRALDDFEAKYGYRLRPEDFVDGGAYNSAWRVPRKAQRDWIDFLSGFVRENVKQLADMSHAAGKEAMMFLGDHWIGMEPFMDEFKSVGLDAVVGSVGNGATLRLISDIEGVKYTEGRLLPYFFPDVFNENGDPAKEAKYNWVTARRAILRKPIDRIGYGGYLKLALQFPEFLDYVEQVCNEFRTLYANVKGTTPYCVKKVAVLNCWGKMRAWGCHMVHHALYQKQNYSYAGIIESLSGAPFDVVFINFQDILDNPAILDDIDVIINVGDADTAHTGGEWWENPKIIEAIRGFVYNGGGIIGVGEPSGHQYQGHFFQLANVFGVEEETGFTLGYDKYNWDEHPGHFILQDCTKPVDFGEGKKSIYALPGTEILVQREKEVQMAVHAFGRGRAVYISGLPYSFENSRVLYRSILWSAHDEESLHKWFSSNFNVEVHAYVKNGKYCVVNNTYEPQSTVVYKGDGSSFALDMAANEIKWYEI